MIDYDEFLRMDGTEMRDLSPRDIEILKTILKEEIYFVYL